MLTYILKRFVALLPVLFGISVLAFVFIRAIPGDPACAILGERCTEEKKQQIRQEYHLNDPLPVQYWVFISNAARGDLGKSIITNRPITEELGPRWHATVELTVAAMLIATMVGIVVGVISARRRNTALDYLTMTGALLGVSIPIFWLGLMLKWLFAVQLGWLPPSGRIDPNLNLGLITDFYVLDSILTLNGPALFSSVKSLILPAVALSTIPMAIIARMTRSAMIEVLSQDYIRTAQAKGLLASVVTRRHALKNAMLPVITVIGLQVGLLLSGAVLTETIFAWGGIGSYIFDSVGKRDYPALQAMILIIALVYVIANLVVDLLYAVLDPRIRA